MEDDCVPAVDFAIFLLFALEMKLEPWASIEIANWESLPSCLDSFCHLGISKTNSKNTSFWTFFHIKMTPDLFCFLRNASLVLRCHGRFVHFYAPAQKLVRIERQRCFLLHIFFNLDKFPRMKCINTITHRCKKTTTKSNSLFSSFRLVGRGEFKGFK